MQLTIRRAAHLIVVGAFFLGVWSSVAPGQPQAEEPKIGVHLKKRVFSKSGLDICGNFADICPCNLEESNLMVQGDVDSSYVLYILLMNVPASVGVNGAAFGFSYGENITLGDWKGCATQQWPGPEHWTSGPESGSGIVLTWGDNCQNAPAVGDSGGEVTVVAGAFYMYAYEADRFSITPRSYASPPDLQISGCDGTVYDLHPQRDTGSAGFGTDYGRDPCRSAYFPAARFSNLTPLELLNIQVKICTLRYSLHRINSVVLAGSGDTLAVRNFFNLARIKHLCVNDMSVAGMPEWDPVVVNPGLDALAAVIDSAFADSVVAAGGVDSSASHLSFAILDVATGEGFEAILGTESSERLVSRILPTLENTGVAYEEVLKFACRTSLAPYDSTTDLTGQVLIISEGIRLDEDTEGQYTSEVVIENTTGSTLQSPVSLVVGTPLGIDVLNADGRTCVLGPGGYFFDIPSLAPGAQYSQIIHYMNPDESLFDVTFAIYAGAKYR